MSLLKFKRRNSLLPATDSWVDNFFNDDFSFLRNRISNLSIPPVNVEETEDGFTLSLAVPGLKKEDFDIAVVDNSLVISRETTDKSEEEDENFMRKEFNYSSFSRSFWLPEDVDDNNIEATYEDGILKIILTKNPKAKAQVSKRIEVV